MEMTGIVELARSLWVVWLLVLFGAVVFWAFRPKNRTRFEEDARIPFRDNDQGGGDHGAT